MLCCFVLCPADSLVEFLAVAVEAAKSAGEVVPCYIYLLFSFPFLFLFLKTNYISFVRVFFCVRITGRIVLFFVNLIDQLVDYSEWILPNEAR